MGENRKIKNAHPLEYNNIKFKSQLEVMTYKTLLEEGLDPQYEKEKFILWDGFIPTIPFYTKNKFKRKDYRIDVISKATCKDNRPLGDITYTPDFTLDYNGRHIIIETKGIANDVFPYKLKLFRKSLEERKDKDNIEVWEIHTKRQLLECLEQLRLNTNNGDKEGNKPNSMECVRETV